MNDNELPGMWESADMTGGDPDERSHAERKLCGSGTAHEAHDNCPGQGMAPKVQNCPKCGASFKDRETKCDLINGCIGDQRPPLRMPRPWEMAGTGPALLPDDHPVMQKLNDILIPMPPRMKELRFVDIGPILDTSIPERTGRLRPSFDEPRFIVAPGSRIDDVIAELIVDNVPQETIDALIGVPDGPKLWESKPDGVVHIAGGCLQLFNRYIRQRCDWCGIILLEYDLTRVAIHASDANKHPEKPLEPGHWTPGSMVLVDGNMQAEYEPNVVDGQPQLPPFSCAFDPETQVR